jgi:hypothetical protein
MFEELGTIARDLLADLERARPGFPDDEEGFAAAVRARLATRLEDLRALHPVLAEPALKRRAEQELDTVLVARYVAFARKQNLLEKKGGGGWRGGDTVSRIVLGLTGLAVGGFVVWAPFIPIWEKSVPFMCMIAAPFIPDMQKAWYLKRHLGKLEDLAMAMEEAGKALMESEPLDQLLNDPLLEPSAFAAFSAAGSAAATTAPATPSAQPEAPPEAQPEAVPVGGRSHGGQS